MDLVRIRFTENRELREQGVVVRAFKAGEVADLPEPSARHWLDRCAELVEPAAEAAPEPEPAAEPDDEADDEPADEPARRGRPKKSA